MTTYIGTRGTGGVQVLVKQEGQPDQPARLLPYRLDLVNHSPGGFEWVYGGSGPAQLALAILAHALGDERALVLYQQFKADVVASLPHEGWTLSQGAIERWLGDVCKSELMSTTPTAGGLPMK